MTGEGNAKDELCDCKGGLKNEIILWACKLFLSITLSFQPVAEIVGRKENFFTEILTLCRDILIAITES